MKKDKGKETDAYNYFMEKAGKKVSESEEISISSESEH